MGPAGPPRRQDSDDDDVPNEPPPAYTASAAQASAQTLEAGPNRPFESSPAPQQQSFRPPTDAQEQWAQTYGRPSVDGASGGSGLFSPFPPQAPLPGQQRPPLAQPSSSSGPPAPTTYAPTTRPTPGQPLLHEGKLLVFSESGHRPSSHSICSKCADTGYKGYGYETGRPCKTCWKRYGKPYSGALRIAVTSPEGLGSLDVQRPLPIPRPPAPRPPPPPPMHHGYPAANYQAQHYGQYSGPPMMPGPAPWIQQAPYGMPPPGALVVRPGDPRLGGRLCGNCGGDGLVPGGFLLLDEYQCQICQGSGRVFF